MWSDFGMRSRWAALGAVFAALLGAGGWGVVSATVSSGERASYFPIVPTRVLDTRNGTSVSNATLKLVVEGPISLPSGVVRTVVPESASAVAVNVTVTEGRKNAGYGFVTAFPCDSETDAVPDASALNFEAGVDVANALNITTSASGSVCLYVHGSADLIVDIAGYYANHDHDDRYYTKAQVDAALGGKANVAGLHPPFRAKVPVTVDRTGDVGRHASIAIGTDGNPVVSYLDLTNGAAKIAVCSDPSCSSVVIRTVDSTDMVGPYTSVAIGVDGNPIFSYLNNSYSALKVAACLDPTCSTAVVSTVDATEAVGWYTSLVIGTDGNPLISYHNIDGYSLMVAACSNIHCDPTISPAVITTVDNSGYVGFNTSIVIGTDGNPVISYVDLVNQYLKVAACTNARCDSTISPAVITSVDNSGYIYDETSIVIGIDGNPVVSYFDSYNRDLKVAICSNPMCTSATITSVSSTNDEGGDSSIVIGLNGNPIISYLDFTNRDLKVAMCSNPMCTSTAVSTVDGVGSVGHHSSIAIGVKGDPIISYFDDTNDDLKVAVAWWVAGGR